MLKLYRNVVMVGLVGLGLAACGDKVTVTQPVTPVPGVTSVSVAPVNLTIAINQQVQYAASVIADVGVATTVTWSSGNAAIATVDANGLVKGITAGTTTIVATSTADAGKKGIASVTVSSTPPQIISFTITPTTATLAPGNFVQISPAFVMNPGVAAPTPTYSTSNAAVATVDASGKVIAVAAGTAVITATAVSGSSTLTAQLGVTVRNLIPATVSISSVTTGILTLPVVLSNVFGQIEVNLNFDPGEQVIDSLAVFIGATRAGKFSYITNPAAGIITVSINTASFTKNYTLGTATVAFLNGNSTISAAIYPRNVATATATQVTPIQLNNLDGWAADITKPTNSAIDVGGSVPGLGFTFWGGPTAPASATVYPVVYTPGRSISSMSFTIGAPGFGTCSVASFTALPFRSTFGTSGTTACVYQNTTTIRDNIIVLTAVDNNLNSYPVVNAVTPLIPNSVVLAACLPATTGCTLGSTPDSLRVDWVGPNTVSNPAIAGAEGFNWVNAAWSFTPVGGAVITDLGVGPDLTSWTTFAGLTTATMTAMTGAATLAETNTNTTDGYQARATAKDLLGNPSNSSIVSTFGVDNTVPVIRYSAVAAPSSFAAIYTAGGTTALTDSTTDNAIEGLYGANVTTPGAQTLFLAAAAGTNDSFRTEALDNRSGLSRSIITSRRFAQGGPTGTTTSLSCASVATGNYGVGLIDGYRAAPAVHMTCGSALAGYYTTSETAVDRAGNRSVTYKRTLALDPAQPQITGVSPFNSYVGNAPVSWSLGSQDDLEVIDARFRILYPNLSTGTGLAIASQGLVWTYALSGTFMGTGFSAGPSSATADANFGFFPAIAQRFDASIVNPQVTTVTQDLFTLNIQETCIALASMAVSCTGKGDPILTTDIPLTKPSLLGVQVRDVFGSWIFNSTAGAAFGVSAEFTSPILSATVAAPGGFTVGYTTSGGNCPQWGAIATPTSWCVNSGINFRNDGVATATVKSFRAVQSLSVTLPIFTRVELYGLNAALEWVFIQRITVPAAIPTNGSITTSGGTITGSDNGLERYWVYSFTGIPANGFTSYRALGVNAAGNGLFSTISL